MAKKYQSYIIEIDFHNGDKETIDMLNSTDVNCENYREMLKVYNEIKDKYKDTNCNINFCGTSSDGCLDVMFTKEIKNNEIHIIEVEEIDEPIKNSIKILDDMELLFNQLKQRNKSIGNYQGAIEKKQDLIHHQAETSLCIPITDEEKIKAFDSLALIQQERRQIKNEKQVIDLFTHNNIFDVLDNTFENIGKIKKGIEISKTIGAEKYIDGLENEQIIKEIKYNSFKQRINLMKDMQKKYDKVAYDDERMVLICYNRCHKQK